jgi:hypothetical protein
MSLFLPQRTDVKKCVQRTEDVPLRIRGGRQQVNSLKACQKFIALRHNTRIQTCMPDLNLALEPVMS